MPHRRRERRLGRPRRRDGATVLPRAMATATADGSGVVHVKPRARVSSHRALLARSSGTAGANRGSISTRDSTTRPATFCSRATAAKRRTRASTFAPASPRHAPRLRRRDPWRTDHGRARVVAAPVRPSEREPGCPTPNRRFAGVLRAAGASRRRVPLSRSTKASWDQTAIVAQVEPGSVLRRGARYGARRAARRRPPRARRRDGARRRARDARRRGARVVLHRRRRSRTADRRSAEELARVGLGAFSRDERRMGRQP